MASTRKRARASSGSSDELLLRSTRVTRRQDAQVDARAAAVAATSAAAAAAAAATAAIVAANKSDNEALFDYHEIARGSGDRRRRVSIRTLPDDTLLDEEPNSPPRRARALLQLPYDDEDRLDSVRTPTNFRSRGSRTNVEQESSQSSSSRKSSRIARNQTVNGGSGTFTTSLVANDDKASSSSRSKSQAETRKMNSPSQSPEAKPNEGNQRPRRSSAVKNSSSNLTASASLTIASKGKVYSTRSTRKNDATTPKSTEKKSTSTPKKTPKSTKKSPVNLKKSGNKVTRKSTGVRGQSSDEIKTKGNSGGPVKDQSVLVRKAMSKAAESTIASDQETIKKRNTPTRNPRKRLHITREENEAKRLRNSRIYSSAAALNASLQTANSNIVHQSKVTASASKKTKDASKSLAKPRIRQTPTAALGEKYQHHLDKVASMSRSTTTTTVIREVQEKSASDVRSSLDRVSSAKAARVLKKDSQPSANQATVVPVKFTAARIGTKYWCLMFILLFALIAFFCIYRWASSFLNSGSESEVIDEVLSCSSVKGFQHMCHPDSLSLEKRVRSLVRDKYETMISSLVSVLLNSVNHLLTESELYSGLLNRTLITSKSLSIDSDWNLNSDLFLGKAHIEELLGYIQREKNKKLKPSQSPAFEDQFHNILYIENSLRKLENMMNTLRPVDLSQPARRIQRKADSISTDEFQRLLNAELQKKLADDIGVADIAKPLARISVDFSKTSPTHTSYCGRHRAGRQHSYIGDLYHFLCFFYHNIPPPESVFSPILPARPCWSFSGNQGNLTGYFRDGFTALSGFGLGHHLTFLEPRFGKKSAPKNVRLFGLNSLTEEEVKIAEMKFDIDSDPIQTVFANQDARVTQTFDGFRIAILDNYGDSYTCLHRVRLFSSLNH